MALTAWARPPRIPDPRPLLLAFALAADSVRRHDNTKRSNAALGPFEMLVVAFFPFLADLVKPPLLSHSQGTSRSGQ
jgi:hypothetical protein